jgi:hypothetical protein
MLTLRQAKFVEIFLFSEAAATGNTYSIRTVCEMKSFIGFVVRQRVAHGNLLAETLPFQIYANFVFNSVRKPDKILTFLYPEINLCRETVIK